MLPRWVSVGWVGTVWLTLGRGSMWRRGLGSPGLASGWAHHLGVRKDPWRVGGPRGARVPTAGSSSSPPPSPADEGGDPVHRGGWGDWGPPRPQVMALCAGRKG